MRGEIALLGIILMAIGVIPLLNLNFPYVYPAIMLLFKYIPLDAFLLSIIFVFIGFVLFIIGLKASKMGKYYRYYG